MPRRYEIIPEDLICGICDKKFEGRSGQLYCSSLCRKAVLNKRAEVTKQIESRRAEEARRIEAERL